MDTPTLPTTSGGRRRWPVAAATLALTLLCHNAQAFPVTVTSVNAPICDNLTVPTSLDELGLPDQFPDDEQVLFDPALASFEPNCADTTAGTPFAITMINNSGRAFDNVWFVADTVNHWIGNFDGYVNEAPAMKIDTVGGNKPLVSESIAADGIFDPNEIWRFNVYGWVAAGQPVLGSAGLVGQPSLVVGAEDSNASIIATPVTGETPPSTVRQCFYECKTTPDGGLLAEVTTLMIANGNPPPAPGVHVPLIAATALILDGRERIVARTETLLSGRDLDELAVCATLLESGIVPPPAGSIQVALESVAGVPQSGPEGVDIWMKNVVGRMKFDEPEPFAGRVTDVGKTICRDVPGDVATAERLLSDPEVDEAPFIPPVLIEDTADPDSL